MAWGHVPEGTFVGWGEGQRGKDDPWRCVCVCIFVESAAGFCPHPKSPSPSLCQICNLNSQEDEARGRGGEADAVLPAFLGQQQGEAAAAPARAAGGGSRCRAFGGAACRGTDGERDGVGGSHTCSAPFSIVWVQKPRQSSRGAQAAATERTHAGDKGRARQDRRARVRQAGSRDLQRGLPVSKPRSGHRERRGWGAPGGPKPRQSHWTLAFLWKTDHALHKAEGIAFRSWGGRPGFFFFLNK